MIQPGHNALGFEHGCNRHERRPTSGAGRSAVFWVLVVALSALLSGGTRLVCPLPVAEPALWKLKLPGLRQIQQALLTPLPYVPHVLTFCTDIFMAPPL